METINTIEEIKKWSANTRAGGKSIGFVPTMGYLHEGHLSLVRKSLASCDRTVVSIFINPAQFRENEDLDIYPVDLEGDQNKLESDGVDVLFFPDREMMYPPGYKTHIEVEEIVDHLCGKSRPVFFRGVATVVLKLFNITRPDKAFFGEKDWQQLTVVETLVRDLNLDVDIVGLPIIRETDQLAMSSRNKYLSQEERRSARSLSRALEAAREKVRHGEHSAEKIRSEIRNRIENEKGTKVDYISICDPQTFVEKNEIGENTLIALAVHIGKARLIDNCIIERE
ncbi:MAG: pantoate--beta-alanine ligase [Nitrospinota bacterium]|nr:pantoate--beta-alanine ligase [Nitrospinota bacterium]